MRSQRRAELTHHTFSGSLFPVSLVIVAIFVPFLKLLDHSRLLLCLLAGVVGPYLRSISRLRRFDGTNPERWKNRSRFLSFQSTRV